MHLEITKRQEEGRSHELLLPSHMGVITSPGQVTLVLGRFLHPDLPSLSYPGVGDCWINSIVERNHWPGAVTNGMCRRRVSVGILTFVTRT